MERQKAVGSRSWLRLLLVPLVAALTVVGVLASPADAAKRAFCRQPWGSLPEQLGNNDPGYPPTLLTNVRAGRNACYDRLVFDLGGPAIGYRVEYVPQVTEEGSGNPVTLRGGAFLSIVLSAPAHDQAGRPTYRPADRANVVDVRSFTTFRQVAFTGDFEGLTSFALGVRARLPFRVLVVPAAGGRSHVVVDVSHRWI